MSVRLHVCVLWKLLCGLWDCVPQKESVQWQNTILWTSCPSSCRRELNWRFLCSAARGDTFQGPDEEVTEAVTTPDEPTISVEPTSSTFAKTTPASPPPSAEGPTPATTSGGPMPPSDYTADTCSGRPFDAFLQLKNGSIYAFRGKRRDPQRWKQGLIPSLCAAQREMLWDGIKYTQKTLLISTK